MSAALTVEGAHDTETFAPLPPPADYDQFPALAGTPAHNVAHLYAHIADALAGRSSDAPSFEDGVELHRTLEAISASASNAG